MKKEWILGVIAFILLIISIVLGIYVYNLNKTKDSNMLDSVQLAKIYNQNSLSNEIVSTSSTEERISPNCTIVEKEYYKDCDHIIRNETQVEDNLINYTKEELAKKYNGWNIEEFTSNRVTVYKEQEGFCPEHYVIRAHNGVLSVYTIDKDGIETLERETEIQTMYLPQEDIEKFEQGVQVVGNSQLLDLLEDFE